MSFCQISLWKNINKKGKNLFVPSLHYKFGQDGWKNRTCSQKFRKFSYRENLLLFSMMFNKVSANFQTLGNNIYTRKGSLTNIYLFKVINRNTKKSVNMFKVNNKDIRTNFCCIYCQLWTYFTPFSSVSPADLEQVNVCWVPPY